MIEKRIVMYLGKPINNTIYMRIFRSYFFWNIAKKKLGCPHYLKQGWYCSTSKQNDPVTQGVKCESRVK